MIDIILKRKPIREFLYNYSNERWKEIIPTVMEIGVLNLKNSFGTYQFSKEDFDSILHDLHTFKPQTFIKEPHKSKKYNHHKKTLLKEVFNNEEKLFEPSQNKKIFHHNKNQNLPRTKVFVTNEHNSKQNSRSNCHNRPKRGYYTT